MGLTIAEKIFSNHVGQPVEAGEIVLTEVDFLFCHDANRPLAIEVFEEFGNHKLRDPSRFAIVLDHRSPSPHEVASASHKKLREFAAATGCHLYEVGQGISHLVIPGKGHIVPGDLMIATDSHTTTSGALDLFACGVGATDFAAAMITGKLWFMVPQTTRILFRGKPGPGIFAKDMMLRAFGQMDMDGATYHAIEFAGEGVSALDMDGRFTLSNMAVELGAKAGIVEADKKTKAYLSGRTDRPYEIVSPDPDARYAETLEFDVSDMAPQVAKPHSVENVCPVTEVLGTPVHQGYIGSCGGGRGDDLEIAAKILRGKRIPKGVRLIVTPGSEEVLIAASRSGALNALVEAGALVVAPGCAGCAAGSAVGIPGDGENVITAATRNFRGRLANPNADLYLASPATVAASALAGAITDCREVLEDAE